MNMHKDIVLTIIAHNLIQKVKAEKLSELLKIELGQGWEIQNIDSYNKFENSYKIELKKTYSDKKNEELNLLVINLTDKLISPWLLYVNSEKNLIELIYNKDENTKCRKTSFNVIKWGHLEIIEN